MSKFSRLFGPKNPAAKAGPAKLARTILIASVIGSGLVAAPASAQREEISNDMSRCRSGPGVIVTVSGFKDVQGRVRVQSYNATRDQWLERGQWINRIDVPVTAETMRFCMPVPATGSYGIAVRHDYNSNRRTDRSDGGGYSNNPDISLTNLEPNARESAIQVGPGVSRINVVLNYLQGLSVEPIRR